MKRNIVFTVVAIAVGAGVISAFVSWIQGREAAATALCVNMLLQFDGAKQQWALETHKNDGVQVTWDELRKYFKGLWNGKPPWDECPGGGHLTIGSVGQLPSCSIRKHQVAFEVEIGRLPNHPVPANSTIAISFRAQNQWRGVASRHRSTH